MLFRVLGPLDVSRPDGRPMEIASDKHRLLLALLLSRANEWVRVDDIVGVLWPEDAPASAVGTVKTFVHHLRQALPRTEAGTPRLNSRADSYRLNLVDSELDAGVFAELAEQGRAASDPAAAIRHLESALELWRGEAFEPLDAEPARARIEELHELRRTTRDALADALLATDRAADAVALLEPLAAADPVREPTWQRLVTALDRAERRDDAVAAFEKVRDALAERDREPGPALARLGRQLLGDEGMTMRIAPGAAGLPTALVPPRPPAEDRRLVTPAELSGPSRGSDEAVADRPAADETTRVTVAGDRPAKGGTASSATGERAATGEPPDVDGADAGTTGREPLTDDRTMRIPEQQAAAMRREAAAAAAADEPVVHVPPLTDLRLRPERPRQNLDPAAWLPPTRTWRIRPLVVVAVLAVVAVAVLGGMALFASRFGGDQPPTAPTAAADTQAAAAPEGVSPRRAVPGLPAADAEPKLLFGLGDRADTAMPQANGATLLTTVYAGREDLPALVAWKQTVVPQAYAAGFALHLVITDRTEGGELESTVGRVCGRAYPLSPQFLADMQELATAFAGTADGPPLYVTVFDDVQDYACTKREFRPDELTQNYYAALSGQYLAAREAFHRTAPNALVSLGWDATMASYDDRDTGGGVSMMRHFEKLLQWSDFTSVSASRDADNAADVHAAVAELGQYGPVLLRYRPATAADADLRAVLADDLVAETVRGGLFAVTFSGDAATKAGSPPVSEAITRYGRPAR